METFFNLGECMLIRKVGPDSPADFTGDCQIPLGDLARRQERVEANPTGIDCSRSRYAPDDDPPIHTVQPLIPERNAVLGCHGLQALASAASHLPTYFEQVGKIRIYREGEPYRNGKEAVVVHSKAFEAEALPQKPGPRQVQRSARNLNLSFINQIGIREIDIKQDVVFFDRRSEQHGSPPVEGQLESG